MFNCSGAINISKALFISSKAAAHRLWINLLDPNDNPVLETPRANTKLVSLSLSKNHINNSGAEALCQALPWTTIPSLNLTLDGNNIDPAIVENGACVTSGSVSRHPSFLEFAVPFLLLFYFACRLFFPSLTEDSTSENDSPLKAKLKIEKRQIKKNPYCSPKTY